jgi:hypothetical protein
MDERLVKAATETVNSHWKAKDKNEYPGGPYNDGGAGRPINGRFVMRQPHSSDDPIIVRFPKKKGV